MYEILTKRDCLKKNKNGREAYEFSSDVFVINSLKTK